MTDDLITITYEDIHDLPTIVITPDQIAQVTEHLEQKQMEGFYRRIRQQITEWAKSKGVQHKYVDYILLAPDFFVLLVRLLTDDRVASVEKKKLVAAIGYYIMPLDIVPEIVLGPVGFIEDVILAVYVLNSLLRNTSEEIIRQHWEGSQDVVTTIRWILTKVDDLLPTEQRQRVKHMISNILNGDQDG